MSDGVNILGERSMTERDFREQCTDQVRESLAAIFAKLAGELGDPFRFEPSQLEVVSSDVVRRFGDLLGNGLVQRVSTLRAAASLTNRDRDFADEHLAFMRPAGGTQ